MESSSGPRNVILASRGDPTSAHGVTRWSERIAQITGGALLDVPRAATGHEVLDASLKRDVRWLVTGLSSELSARGAARVPADVGLLLRRACCPVLTVQSWADAPASPPSVAVVGVDGSGQARAAAHAAIELLEGATRPARLVLVHGASTHPSELAARTPWRELVADMQLARHEWILRLAAELQQDGVDVDVVVDLVFAPDLIGGVARRAGADFVALGAAARSEGLAPRPGAIHERTLLGTPSPLLTTAASGPRRRYDARRVSSSTAPLRP